MATLKYDPDFYIPSNLNKQLQGSMSKEIRAEYSRLRGIAMKRLKRLEAADMDDTQAYLKNYKHYPALKDIKTSQELAGRLSDLSRFITAKASTVSGQREIRSKSIATLHENGYTFVNDDNIVDFGRFMEEYRKQKLDKEGYDSGDAAETFSIAEKHLIDPDELYQEFEFWLANVDTAKKLKRSANDGNYQKVKKRLENKVNASHKKRRRSRYSGALKSVKSGKSRKRGKR